MVRRKASPNGAWFDGNILSRSIRPDNQGITCRKLRRNWSTVLAYGIISLISPLLKEGLTLTAPQKGRIFISYRRADSAGYAGRIYDRLTAHFGEDAVFMDVDTSRQVLILLKRCKERSNLVTYWWP